ncbi:MAG TPA: hypothetical protein VMU49_05315 [Candidatus Acidoferrales bacterium]|nr:hypothetical protein [Candidatus Acidoferrales bacterium]
MSMDPFAAAEARYRHLSEERREGRLEPRAFRNAVRQLRVEDGESRQWVLGPENGAWYRRERDRWMESEPPRRLVCPRCAHHNLVRHSFCVECGAVLDRREAG